MDNSNKKQQAIEQVTKMVETVEETFQTNDIFSWEQLFILYYCITTMDDDIPQDIMERIKDCGFAAYAFLLSDDSAEESMKPSTGINCNRKPTGNNIKTLQGFFELGAGKPDNPLYIDGLKRFASPEYVKIWLDRRVEEKGQKDPRSNL